MTTQTLPVRIKSPTATISVALALAWSVDLLFYGKMIGISLVLFVLLFLGGLVALGEQGRIRPVRRNLWLFLPLLFFATMAFLRANPFLTLMNVLATFSLLSYIAFFYANSQVSALGTIGALILPARVTGNSLIEGLEVITSLKDSDTKSLRVASKKHLLPILRGVLLALPVLIVFTMLLTSADLIFADYVREALDIDIIPNLFEYSWRGVLIGLVAWVLGGNMAYAISRADASDDDSWIEKIVKSFPRLYSLGLTETITLMVLVNLLFLAFAGIQFTYIFGGQANINLAGFTYAEYARRGFAELVAVAILTLGMILVLNWITRRESKGQIKLFNTLATLMVGFVMIMLVSAWQRMNLYETTYGYTELRLYTYVFMAWMGIVLCWFLATLWSKPHFFSIGLILAALGFLGTLNLINPDAFIAKQNLARYETTGDLDVYYLNTLSDDAIPQLLEGLALTQNDLEAVKRDACRNFEPTVETSPECFYVPSVVFQDELQNRLDKRVRNTEWRKWQSFHYSRWMGFQRLDSHFNGK